MNDETSVKTMPSSTLAFLLGHELNNKRVRGLYDAKLAIALIDEIEKRLGVVDDPHWSCPVCGRMYRPEQE